MHVTYFIPGPMSRGPLGFGELDRRKAYLERQAAPGTVISVRESEEGPASIESAAEEYLAVPGLLAAAPVLESEGTNAIIVGCFGDPGLSAARELTGIPVVGPGQASGHLAAQLGSRFAVLTVVGEVVPAIRRQMRGHGLEGFLSEVRAVDVPVLELRERRDEVLGTLEHVGREVIKMWCRSPGSGLYDHGLSRCGAGPAVSARSAGGQPGRRLSEARGGYGVGWSGAIREGLPLPAQAHGCDPDLIQSPGRMREGFPTRAVRGRG